MLRGKLIKARRKALATQATGASEQEPSVEEGPGEGHKGPAARLPGEPPTGSMKQLDLFQAVPGSHGDCEELAKTWNVGPLWRPPFDYMEPSKVGIQVGKSSIRSLVKSRHATAVRVRVSPSTDPQQPQPPDHAFDPA